MCKRFEKFKKEKKKNNFSEEEMKTNDYKLIYEGYRILGKLIYDKRKLFKEIIDTKKINKIKRIVHDQFKKDQLYTLNQIQEFIQQLNDITRINIDESVFFKCFKNIEYVINNNQQLIKLIR